MAGLPGFLYPRLVLVAGDPLAASTLPDIALFGSLSAGEEFLNIGHLQTHTKTFAMVPGTLGRTLYRVVNRK